jgi:GNAT superfamily N-acetyltransferase
VSLEVRSVKTRRDRRAFVELPFALYGTDTPWIPPLKLERRLYLQPRFNAFFEHGEAELFLAERDGRVVGRISAHVDEAYNTHHGARWGWFGFLEVEDDAEALRGLLDAAERWLRARGMERMVGPADFTLNDGCGVLVDGFEIEPIIRQNWNRPYLPELCAAVGLEKAMDMFFWHLHISDRAGMMPILPELAKAAREQHGMRLRKMTRRSLRRDLDVFGEIYNDAWKDNWGFAPYSATDLDHYAQEMQLAFDSKWFMVAEAPGGEPVGVAITVPDVNQALARMKGRLLPDGWWQFLRKSSYIDRCRVGFLGVKPEWQHTGVAALLYIEHFDLAEVERITQGEMGWILETNIAMNKAMQAMNGQIVKRYRMYERRFWEGVEPAWPADARVFDPTRVRSSRD